LELVLKFTANKFPVRPIQLWNTNHPVLDTYSLVPLIISYNAVPVKRSKVVLIYYYGKRRLGFVLALSKCTTPVHFTQVFPMKWEFGTQTYLLGVCFYSLFSSKFLRVWARQIRWRL